MEINTVSITLWGDALKKGKWCEWYHDIKKMFQDLGHEITHIGIQSEMFDSRKILTTRRKEKQVLLALQQGEEPISFSCYSLPDDYKSASFDYDVLLVRKHNYISLIINLSDYNNKVEEDMISLLLKYIEFESGEVYQMDRMEMPLIYAAKANLINQFKTLKVYKKF